jgi:hypothetical protein
LWGEFILYFISSGINSNFLLPLKIFKLCQIFKWYVYSLRVMILLCILATRQKRMLKFLCVYFWINLFTSISSNCSVFLYGTYVISQ